MTLRKKTNAIFGFEFDDQTKWLHADKSEDSSVGIYPACDTYADRKYRCNESSPTFVKYVNSDAGVEAAVTEINEIRNDGFSAVVTLIEIIVADGNGITRIEKLGIQQLWLKNTELIGANSLVHPTKLFHACVSAGLIPSFPAYLDPESGAPTNVSHCLENVIQE
ncbi:unnamed protein product [Nesidiocoris tenuis]|uniref:Uncharacterized protein n=1 Tax=Nesidiocoris tenuis TaxID=355587 RepID=A0A6H5GS14_9HEMI|nr:unnamed protein product [Nesidiocoris tenuis]